MRSLPRYRLGELSKIARCAPMACWLILRMRIIQYNAKMLADSDANQVAVQDSFNASEVAAQDCDLVDDGEGVSGGDEVPLAGLASESGVERGQCKENSR